MSGSLLDMESPVIDEEGHVLKHADSDSVNSIPPPPPPLGMSTVPVASEESCDITEQERLRQADDDDEAERQHRELEAQQLQQQHLYAEPHQLRQEHQQHLQQQQQQHENHSHHEEDQSFQQQQNPEEEPLQPLQQHQSNEEDGAENDTQELQAQQQMLVAVEPTTSSKQKEAADGHSDTCCDKFLKCLGLVPCPTLLSWILLLLGLGCMVGAILFGTWDTRTLLDDDDLLWFMEYTVIGVSVGMFVVGCLVLLSSHLSSEPTSRRVFNSFKKNRCAQGMNIFALVVCYILTVVWVLATAIFGVPLVLIINMFIVDADSVDLGFLFCVIKLIHFFFFTSVTFFNLLFNNTYFLLKSVFTAVFFSHPQICFIICITANITHLRDNRFSTLNAYGSEEVRNSKHSVLDTNM
ncbi:hypothetical protein EGW08_003066 [Elysia chlorotica]|uniref:Uncharacterized protein n=1 Tax=Elysia chlorotica TaxID=188477 RepID=A0A433U5T7_ELYCH|nr:hypothetical protein EGW08_003066 [Elysia chlorotica]